MAVCPAHMESIRRRVREQHITEEQALTDIITVLHQALVLPPHGGSTNSAGTQVGGDTP